MLRTQHRCCSLTVNIFRGSSLYAGVVHASGSCAGNSIFLAHVKSGQLRVSRGTPDDDSYKEWSANFALAMRPSQRQVLRSLQRYAESSRAAPDFTRIRQDLVSHGRRERLLTK